MTNTVKYPRTSHLIPKEDLLDKPLSTISLRQLLEAIEQQDKELQDLSVILKDLDKAIMQLELEMGSQKGVRIMAFKLMRETFNRILPKWFHK